MKKFLSFAFALLLSIGVSAQTSLTTAVNFTSTAHNGEQIDLFEILDGGQYVLIDFFFTTCGPCKETTPRIVDAYYRLGCNEGDVYFMEVSPTDYNASYMPFVDNWIETYNIPYPTIHTQTGGDTGDKIYEMYGIAACPTLVLIAPDHSIALKDFWPESADHLVEYFTTNFDIEENYCGNQTPEVSIAKTKVNDIVQEASTKVHVDFYANAATESFYYTISESANLTAEDVISEGTQTEDGDFSYTFEGLTESTTYFVYAQSIAHDGSNGNMTVLETRTLCPGDEGEVEIELSIQITAAYVVATAIPNESTSEYHFGFCKKEYYDAGEVNQFNFLNILVNDDTPFCDQATYEVEAENIPGNTPYYVVAVGRNGEGEWFAPSLYEFVVEKEAAGEATVALTYDVKPTSVTLYAEPNAYTVEFHYGICIKSVFDQMGEAVIVEQVRNDGYPAYADESATWNNLVPETEYVAIGTAKNADNIWGTTTIEYFTTPKGDALSELESAFEIYPNPASSTVNIKSSVNGNAQINIVDMTGRCVKQIATNDMSNVSVNVEDLNKGIYFISIQQDNNYNIQKLVIE